MTLVSIFYVILAIASLSFLVFIHELGHYWMARRLGMRVETFSIGFGKPIYSWVKEGVKWQIGWLLFGGFVKIAGMETGGEQSDPYQVKDGFFGKSPFDRIKVAFMGPLVNILFALLVFSALFFAGGREKTFSEYTHKIGWVDPKSELYAKGVRPGDEIASYNGIAYQGAKDHLTAPIMANQNLEIIGYKVDPQSKRKIPFAFSIKPYPHPNAMDKEIVTSGILQPASYIIYGDKDPTADLPEGSPMRGSGILKGDRIVWADGEIIYSPQQLSFILNESQALLTIRRGEDVLLRRVPRVLVEEIKLSHEVKEELTDWQFEARLRGTKFSKLYYLPYNLNQAAVVEGPLKFIDKEKESEIFPQHLFSSLEEALKEGDQIIAVDGKKVSQSYEVLQLLQQHRVNLIVERDPKLALTPLWTQADGVFDSQFEWTQLHRLVSEIGISDQPKTSGNLVLLNSIVPKMRKDFAMTPENVQQLQEEMREQALEVANIEDPEKRAVIRHMLENREKQLLLGLPTIQDAKVEYNPNPAAQFNKVVEEIWHTVKALLTGSLNPKWMSGPVGIVQLVHDNSMISWKEALFWLGAISLNLGVFNLFPLPVLDGGTICLSLIEIATGRRLSPKALEKLIIPFALLLIGLFLFVTYHDLLRILSHWSK